MERVQAVQSGVFEGQSSCLSPSRILPLHLCLPLVLGVFTHLAEFC